MQSGLWSKRGTPVPLVGVTVEAKVIEFAAQINVRQKYKHKEPEPIEATFKFPLDLFGALCGFTVVLEGKEIKTQVKSREETWSISNDEVNDDDSQDVSYILPEEQPDVFVCNIGSLAPGKEVEFKLTYVTELPSEGDALRFFLPASTIGQRFIVDDNDEHKQENPYNVPPHHLSVKVDLTMPNKIEKIESPTHPITIHNQEGSNASIEFSKDDANFAEPNFVMLVKFANQQIPGCILEEDEQEKTSTVMLSFFPQLSILQENTIASEIIFLIDCSYSMGGTQLDNVKSALHLFLKSLPKGTYFNLIEFGSTHDKLFPTSVEYTDENLEKAINFINNDMDADMGGTELYEPLADVLSQAPVNNLPRQLFIITDGQAPKTKEIFSLVRQNNTRVFTFGIGDKVSHYLVNGIARAGCGEAEFLTSNEKLEAKVMRQLKRALQPALRDVIIDWGEFKDVVQAPETLRTLFNGDRLLVYGFLNSIKEGTVTLKANAPTGPVSFPIHIDPAAARKGRFINVLAAGTRIRDLEESEPYDSEEIIRLGITYGLASSATSFVPIVDLEEPATQSNAPKAFSLHSSTDFLNDLSITKSTEALSLEPSRSTDNVSLATPTKKKELKVQVEEKGKRVYAPDFLLRFKPLFTDLPTGLGQAPIDIILGTTGGRSRNDDRPPKSPKGGRGRGGRGGGGGHKRSQSGGKPMTPGRGKPSKVVDQGPPVAPLTESENRWIRPKLDTDAKDAILRKAQGLLNRLTIEKFEPLSTQILNVGINDVDILKKVIRLVFDKAVSEPNFSTMYAVLCKKLSIQCPQFPDDEGNTQTFRRILLNKCQEEFENKTPPNFDAIDPLLREEEETKYRRRILGNIKFIGELYKEQMLPEKIMHEITMSLIRDIEKENPAEEDIESLCKLITTIGRELDVKSKSKVDEYIAKLNEISENKKIPSRLRFNAKEVIELRNNNWVSRRKDNDPKTIAEARAEAMKEQEEVGTPIKRSESREGLRESGGPGSQDFRSGSRDNLRGSKDWDSPYQSRRGGKYSDKKGTPISASTSWEGGRGGYGRGRGKSPNKEFVPKPRIESSKSSDISPYKPKALSSSVSEDFASPTKSALKTSTTTNSDKSKSTNSVVRKEVTIQEPTKPEDLEKKAELILEEYWSAGDMGEAQICIEELNSSDYHSEIINKAVMVALEKKDRERVELAKLFHYLSEKSVFTLDDYIKGFSGILEIIEDIEPDIPFAPKYISEFIGSAMNHPNPLPFSFMEDTLSILPLGKSATLACNVLSAYKTVLQNDEKFIETFKTSNFDLAKLMPRDARDTDSINKFYASKGLSILASGTPAAATEETEPLARSVNRKLEEDDFEEEESTDASRKQFQNIIRPQAAEGYWKFNEQFCDALGFTYDEVAGAMPEAIEETDNFAIWSTLLALAYLKQNYGSIAEQWELLSGKAKEWLSKEISKNNLTMSDLENSAAQFLKDE